MKTAKPDRVTHDESPVIEMYRATVNPFNSAESTNPAAVKLGILMVFGSLSTGKILVLPLVLRVSEKVGV